MIRGCANIVLVGMPGSGKSSVGRRLAKRLHWTFVDTDALIVAAAGKSIERIFAEDGEAYFRDLEARCVREAAAHTGVVIATGGGVVLREENVRALRATGLIVFLDRAPERILKTAELSDRPLLRAGGQALFALYRQRKDVYRAACDCRVPNNGRRLKPVILTLLKLRRKMEGLSSVQQKNACGNGYKTRGRKR